MLFKYNLLGIHFHFDQNDLGVRFQDNAKTLHIICKMFNVQIGVVSRGRFAIFCEPSMSDAQSFIDKWLRKECCDNLKHVMLFNPTGRPFDDTLLENFGHKRIDRKTMPTVPERYPFDKDDAYYIGAGPDKFKIDGSYYAERFDGKFATIAYFWDVYIVFSVGDQRPW
ncbi:hypothetical protein CAEBREN_08358 [Caenorhabditis brenneri]|uniref:Uncharacterized protein n=1 Tax=Caenorhabditis brenneri TaxID=135651 RepID=G0NMQ2_CAEBE|nr:hypothetical protein CAEBREN_08358 [Caenorhabditis brenneri]